MSKKWEKKRRAKGEEGCVVCGLCIEQKRKKYEERAGALLIVKIWKGKETQWEIKLRSLSQGHHWFLFRRDRGLFVRRA